MSARELRARLRDAPLPGEEDARERAWDVVQAAYARRELAPRRARHAPVAAVLAAAAVVIAVVVGLTPPGAAVGEWVRGIVKPAPPPPPAHVRDVLGPLPGGGRLLVTAPSGTWILQADGTRRRLGSYEDATFSPLGLFVAVTRGNLLAAVDPHGHVRWTLTRPLPVSRPSWSPDGFRVAYRSGRELRVVYGDGALDRRLAPRSAPVTPVWRPAPGHHLAAVAADRRTIVLRDTDSGRVVWRAMAPARVIELAWSADGRRLLALTPRAIAVLGAGGRTLRVVRPTGADASVAGVGFRRAAWLPDGRSFAVVRLDRQGTQSKVVLVGHRRSRTLLAVPGRITEVLAAPGGRRLLLSAPGAGQWLLVRTSGGGGLTALSHVARQFDPGGRGRPALPDPVDWIH